MDKNKEVEIKIKEESKYALDLLLKIYNYDNYDDLIKYLIEYWKDEYGQR